MKTSEWLLTMALALSIGIGFAAYDLKPMQIEKVSPAKNMPHFKLVQGKFNRHFIVYYVCVKEGGRSWNVGLITLDCVGYPNYKVTTKYIEEKFHFPKGNVVLTNINELSTKDNIIFNLQN